jgi:hypothetical protein
MFEYRGISERSNMLTEVISFRQEVAALLSEYLQRRIAAGELRPHEPRVTIHMLVSSMLILLFLDQPFEPFVEQFVETIVDGIRAT